MSGGPPSICGRCSTGTESWEVYNYWASFSSGMAVRALCLQEWECPDDSQKSLCWRVNVLIPHDPQYLPWKWGGGVICAIALLWAPALCSSSLGLCLWIVFYSPSPLQRKRWVPELPNREELQNYRVITTGRQRHGADPLDPPYTVQIFNELESPCASGRAPYDSHSSVWQKWHSF